MYDVIIIGAGPAGLKCAEQFKNTKFSVLLIEKNRFIGPKVCAGGLTNLTKDFDFPENKIRKFEKQFLYFNDKKYSVNLLNPIQTIDRYDLGQYQLSKIQDCENIEILKETNVLKIKEDEIVTNKGSFSFKYLVGADGSFSIVRKFLGLKNKISIGLCFKSPEIKDEFAFYFYPKVLGSGYTWVFPQKEYTSVGVYYDPEKINAKRAKDFLFEFSRDKGYEIAKLEAGPINSLYSGFKFKNIFLAGDAAGLASGITGEGISFALISGEEVGKKIIEPNYKTEKLEQVINIKRRQEKTKKMFAFFSKTFFGFFVKLINNHKIQKYFGV